MPYVILTANGEEILRTEINGPSIIGRSADCQVAVRDVLMSRQHARLEPGIGRDSGRWKYIDLGSSNGSHVNWKRISQYILVDGDAVRMGRTWLTFRTGKFEPAPPEVKKRTTRLVRPADPHEALSGTVADFIYVDRDEKSPAFDIAPSPPGKGLASGKAIYSPLQELSSSWDSIVATASRQTHRARPIPYGPDQLRPVVRREVDLSLHALPMQVPYLEVVTPATRRKISLMPAFILTVGIGVATLLVLVSGWMMTKG